MDTFEVIRPRSLVDADYEDYEYLIRWLGRDRADYQYMFYDAELQNKVRNEVINSEDSTRIEALVDSEKREILLTADDLTLNDLEIIGQLFGNKYVTRVRKDGTEERFAPDANSFKRRLMDGRYKVEFTLIASDLAVWK